MSNVLKMKKPFRAIGIDLGTTNSTVAEVVLERGRTGTPVTRCLEIVQPTEAGEYTHILVPSFVAFSGGREWVGEGAKQLRSLSVERGLERNKSLFHDCKNDMGLLRTYHRAPEGYRMAAEIAGHVLRFLHDSAAAQGGSPDHVVVTVPASFQAAQRADTLKACTLAGLSVRGGDLLDEPVAAFLDYMVRHRADMPSGLDQGSNLLVFDFGGGTCDVAVLQVGLAQDADGLLVSPRAVSRYHRLGGGDIDAAILYEVLLPQLMEQNAIEPFNLGYEQKKRFIEPAFVGTAEALKIGLCREIKRLRAFGKEGRFERAKVFKSVPGMHTCTMPDGSTLKLTAPTLTAAHFEALLEPFLDTELLYARETEYRLTCSIFAPILDALDRSGLDRKDIAYCLPVGGSCLIPQVLDALEAFFPSAAVLESKNEETIQSMVARGAAYHALSLGTRGRGLVRAVCHDTIAIRTRDGLVDLIERNTELPYPKDDSFRIVEGLSVPETVLGGALDLRVEILVKEEERILLTGIWEIPGPVNEGDPLTLRYRYDQNQVLTVELRLKDRQDEAPFRVAMENPLTNVVNPHSARMQIDGLEEELRTGRYRGEAQLEKLSELSGLYADIGQREKAVEILGRVLRVRNRPDAVLLNQMAGLYSDIGDDQRAEKFYREAAGASSWAGPWFNLALLLRHKGRLEEAAECVEKALNEDEEPPYHVLRAQLAEKMGDHSIRDTHLEQALAGFAPLTALDDWRLGWYHTALKMDGQEEKAEEGRKEIQRRAKSDTSKPIGGELPQGPRALVPRGE